MIGNPQLPVTGQTRCMQPLPQPLPRT